MYSSINDEIIENARNGEISREEALSLMEIDPFALFSFANELRKDAVGDKVTYVINRNIYLTNMCTGSCGFCAFKAKNGYILSTEEVLEEVEKAHVAGATEVCVQGGYIPQLTMEYYAELFDAIRSNYPAMTMHALSPMEVNYAARMGNMSVEEACGILKDCGVGTMTGTSAEILVDRVRKIICPDKITRQQWIDTVENISLRRSENKFHHNVRTCGNS